MHNKIKSLTIKIYQFRFLVYLANDNESRKTRTMRVRFSKTYLIEIEKN